MHGGAAVCVAERRRKKGSRKYSWLVRPRNGAHVRPPPFLHRFLALPPRYMHYRRRGKILSHFSFPSLSPAAAAFVRFCDLAVRRRMINDISLSTAGCCRRRRRRWMVARCLRRRLLLPLPPPPSVLQCSCRRLCSGIGGFVFVIAILFDYNFY